MTGTPNTPNASTRCQNSPTTIYYKKRKYDRNPDTEAMAQLRAEAAKALKKKLGLSLDPKNVNFNTKPFPRRKTIYLWKKQSDAALTDEEDLVLKQTIESDQEHRRYLWRWTDHQRRQLASLIRREVLVPEYFDRSGSNFELHPAAWEPSPSDTDAEAADTDVEDDSQYLELENSSSLDTQTLTGERPMKRRRGMWTSPDHDMLDGDESTLLEVTAPSVTSINENSVVVDSQTQTAVTPTADRLERGTMIVKLPVQPSLLQNIVTSPLQNPPISLQSPDKQVDTTSPTGPNLPRTMSLNSQGILELDPLHVPSISPVAEPPLTIPIAASPFYPTVNTLSSFAEQIATDTHEDQNCRKELMAIEDMKRMMKAWLDHATSGFLSMPQMRENMNFERKRHEEEKGRLERQIQMLCSREAGLKASESDLRLQISRYLVIVDQQKKMCEGLQVENEAFAEEQEEMKEKIKVLEENLASSKVAEAHLRQNEVVMKKSYQTLEAENNTLKETKEQVSKELQTEIEDLKRIQTELKTKLKVEIKCHRVKENTLQSKIGELESKVSENEARECMLRDHIKVLEDEKKELAAAKDAMQNEYKETFGSHLQQFVTNFFNNGPSSIPSQLISGSGT